jgi:membrane protein implicated in regulation of membrane protease activity
MSRKNLIALFAVLVLLTPFLGLPYGWLMLLLPVLGALILIVVFVPRRVAPPSHAREEERGE